MPRRRTMATVPEPYTTVDSLRSSVMALKELVEVLTGQRGERTDAAVTWQDLLDLGLIKPEQVPPDLGSNRAE